VKSAPLPLINNFKIVSTAACKYREMCILSSPECWG